MLLSDENQERGAMKDEEIARVLTHGGTGAEEGVEAALRTREQVNPARGSWTAKLTHLSEPPEGRAGWRMRCNVR